MLSCILDIKDTMLICTMASISFHSCTFTNHAKLSIILQKRYKGSHST